jgi:hypothetical protein
MKLFLAYVVVVCGLVPSARDFADGIWVDAIALLHT